MLQKLVDMKELFELIEKLIQKEILPMWGELLVKWENGKVKICEETKKIKPT